MSRRATSTTPRRRPRPVAPVSAAPTRAPRPRTRPRSPTSASSIGRHPDLAADHQRGRAAPGLAGERRRSTSRGRAEPDEVPGDPAERDADVRAGDPQRPRPGGGGGRAGRATRGSPGRDPRADGSPFGDAMVEAFEAVAARRGGPGGRSTRSIYGGAPHRQPASLARTAAAADGHRRRARPGRSGEPRGTLAHLGRPLDPSQLPAPGSVSPTAFKDAYGRAPGRYAAYGYEAMAVILDCDRPGRRPTDRTSVRRRRSSDTADRDSVLGTYSINSLGETTLARIERVRVRARRAAAGPRPLRSR